jgi:hypothetical protein
MMRALFGVIASLVLACPAFAADDDDNIDIDVNDNSIDTVRLDVHGDFDNEGAVGVGVRADIPVLANGILGGRVRDELAISPGAEFFFADLDQNSYDGGAFAVPELMLQWNIYARKRWSVFPEAGAAVFIGDGAKYIRNARAVPDKNNGPVFAVPAVALGARYHFNDRNSLLLRYGPPAGVQAGLTF